jgi:hypothetical protein
MLEERNIFQAFTFHSKDVQVKPEGGSTTRCVKIVTYFNAVIKTPFIENIFFLYFGYETTIICMCGLY